MDDSLTTSYASKQAFGTYTWIAGTWWFHQKYFVHKKNALNLAFFSGFSFFVGIGVATMLSKSHVHDAFVNAG